MSRLIRYSLITCAAVALLAAVAVLAFNIHLQSPGMRERLRQAAMETIGLPLTIHGVNYTPWGGIRLQGLVVPDMENEGVNFLEASEFRIVFRLLPLLRREFVVSRLVLNEAILTWRQNEAGKWRVPRDPSKAVAHVSGTPVIPQPSSAPEVLPPPPSVADAASPFRVTVERMEVLHSRILFENRDSWPLLDAEGIKIRADLDADGAAQGQAGIPEAVLAGLVVTRDLSSSFTLDRSGLLILPDIRADIAGGTFSGNGTMALREEGTPYAWELELAGFNLRELRIPPNVSGVQLEGLLNANFHLKGCNAPQRKLDGTGHVEVQGGRLVPPPNLRELGNSLNIQELSGMDLHEARADLRFQDDLIHVEPFWLRSDGIAVELRGTVARGGQLNLNGLLFLSPEVAAKLSILTRRELPPANREGLTDYRVLDFKVEGTLQNPQSNLLSRLLGGSLGGRIGGMLLRFLGVP